MKEKIIAYLENELSPQDRIAFEQALKSDVELQKAFIFQKAQWEKLALLRYNAKAAALLSSFEAVEEEYEVADAPKTTIIKPMPFAFMTVRRVRYAALAAATLLFLFNYNSLINWIKPSTPTTKSSEIVADKPVITPAEPTPSVAPATPVTPTPSVAPVTPHPKTTVSVPTPKRPKSTTPKSTPPHITPTPHIETAEVVKEMPIKVGSPTSNDSIFLKHQPQKDTIHSKMPLDGSVISLDNMYDFKSLISKHLSKMDCNNYTVSFVIKADGTIEEPKLEKGDKNCEESILSQIKTMPKLKKPIYDGRSVDYRYYFTKE
jgi:hypothetical protein